MPLRTPRRSCATASSSHDRRPAARAETHRPSSVPRGRLSAARFARRPVDPLLEERVMACVEHRAGIPERFPAPLVALLLVTYAAEVDGELEAFTETWFEGFFTAWLAERATFPEELATDVVDTVGDIIEGLVEAEVVEVACLAIIRERDRWGRLLADTMRACRSHLA